MKVDAPPAVVCRGIIKSYRTKTTEVKALRGIDLEVRNGELMMLVGPSGCGKTTLISIIAGILSQDEGECLVFGQDMTSMSGFERTNYRGKTVGFVFQSYNLIPTLTAAENVAIPLIIHGTTYKAANKLAKEMLDRVGIGDRSKSLPRELSGGQQQRVAIARSLIHEPKLIVCDEPTAALDHDTGHRVMELFQMVAKQNGRSLIVVTHDSRIFSFADRIAKLDDGMLTELIEDSRFL